MRRIFLLLGALGLIAARCGGDDGVSVDKPWARNSPMMPSAGAVYLDLSSGDTDRLLGVSVDSSIAGKAEIHETVAADDSMHEEGTGGAMMMQEVGETALPVGGTVSLEPGSFHIMLLEIASPLELGQKFDLTLTFENGGGKVVEVEVREEAP